jgi:hypothetical protein
MFSFMPKKLIGSVTTKEFRLSPACKSVKWFSSQSAHFFGADFSYARHRQQLGLEPNGLKEEFY